MSKNSKMSLVPYLFAVLIMVSIGAIVELMRAGYPIIKDKVVSFAHKLQKFYSRQLRNSNKKLTVT